MRQQNLDLLQDEETTHVQMKIKKEVFRSLDGFLLGLCVDFLQPENKSFTPAIPGADTVTAPGFPFADNFGGIYCNQFLINDHRTRKRTGIYLVLRNRVFSQNSVLCTILACCLCMSAFQNHVKLDFSALSIASSVQWLVIELIKCWPCRPQRSF